MGLSLPITLSGCESRDLASVSGVLGHDWKDPDWVFPRLTGMMTPWVREACGLAGERRQSLPLAGWRSAGGSAGRSAGAKRPCGCSGDAGRRPGGSR